MPHVHEGRCLCGDVQWTAEGDLGFMTHCHCSRCRKAHGAPFATYAFVDAAGFRLRGEQHVHRFESSPNAFRRFCGRCGSVVPGYPRDGLVELAVGSLTTDPAAQPIAHIFVGSKLPWYAITDGLAQYDTFPPGVDVPVQSDLPQRQPPTPGGTRGSCLCGAVRFVVEGAPITARNCHCSRCRLARAAAHAANLMTSHDGIRVTQGSEQIASFKIPEAQFFLQTFCRTCGGKTPRFDAGRGIAIAPLGALDDEPALRPEMHMFVASKAAWFAITDALPQHAEGVPFR
jgi:hypothetical protein